MRLNLRQVSKNLKNHHKSIQLRDQSIKKLINTNETPTKSSKYRHLSYTAETETDKTRISPTYAGLLHQGMSPQKGSVAMQPSTVNSTTTIPGNIGWGVDRPHLFAESKMVPIDTMIDSHPIDRLHVRKFDKNRDNRFPQTTGVRAESLDRKLGIDYDIFHAMNKQGQRAIIKTLD